MRLQNSALETDWMTVLHQARLDNGMRSVFVAEALGVPANRLWEWEALRRAPGSFAIWNDWASFFRLPPVVTTTDSERALANTLRAAKAVPRDDRECRCRARRRRPAYGQSLGAGAQ